MSHWRQGAAEQYRRLWSDDAQVLATCLLLYEGWEMDNHAWLVRLPDGGIALRTTDHGGRREYTGDGALNLLREVQRGHSEAVISTAAVINRMEREIAEEGR